MCLESKFYFKIILLSEENTEVSENIIDFFADSEFPNSFFVKQFELEVYSPYYEKKYWRSFARILVKRGARRTRDVSKKILYWLQDLNWPGSAIIFNYVADNIAFFKDIIRECIVEATDNDEEWIMSLFSVSFKSQHFDFEKIKDSTVTILNVYDFENSRNKLLNLYDDNFKKII